MNWNDYGQRNYDPQLGRFHNEDRFAEKYYNLTPYQYGANNPVLLIDINGDSLWINYKGNNILYNNGSLTNRDGTSYTGRGVRKDGSLKGFLKHTVNALNTIESTQEGAAMLEELQSSTNNFHIEKTSGDNRFVENDKNDAYAVAKLDANQGKPSQVGSGGTIYWNRHSGTSLEVGGKAVLRPIINLAHELAHGSDANKGWLDNRPIIGLARDEWRASSRENIIRNQMGLPYREFYRAEKNAGTGQMRGLAPSILNNGSPINIQPPSSWWFLLQ